ncbi:PD40 domain-containing protein [Persicimonas caeni]|nr:PD40 domain-containing protein [Persicimonas caeni]
MAASNLPRVLSLFICLSLVGLGCDDGRTTIGSQTESDTGDCTGSECSWDTGGPDDGGGSGDTGDHGPLTAIQIEPASVDLLSENGSQPQHDFAVVATFADGHTEPFGGDVEFSVADEKIGYIDAANGNFVAHGILGGETQVTATAVDATAGIPPATATVRVFVKRTLVADGLPDDVAQSFQGAQVTDPTRASTVVYPLDGAVMPENVYPADIQWTNGVQDDIFQIRLVKPSAEVVSYVKHTGPSFGNHWLADADAWRAMAQTEQDEPMSIAVTRLEAASGDVIGGTPVRMRFAKGTVAGSVYYWDIGAGRIVRIKDGTGTPEQFMPTPPDDGTGTRCVGCHSVSNSGRYMVGRLGGGDNIGTVFDLTQDLSGNPPPSEFPVDPNNGTRWWFSTWNPDDTRLMVTQTEGGANGKMALMDPFTGQVVPPQSGALPGGGVTHPSWSPDGSLIAYINNVNAWGGANTTGDVAVLPVTGPDSFGAPQTLRAGTDIPNAQPAGQAASYPTWSPDSQWIAFAHGTGSRSEDKQAALYMMRRDGSGVVRLDHASGGPSAADTFQPNFSPFETEDYFWLSYLSRRDYGNAQAGTQGASRQQIWVSAVKKNPDPGQDPSEVGYWLPGQNTQSMNIAAYWAPQACRQDGEGCSVGGECCSGECLPDEGGDLVCSPPPPERCRELTETCSTSADCCEGLLCAANVCYPADG